MNAMASNVDHRFTVYFIFISCKLVEANPQGIFCIHSMPAVKNQYEARLFTWFINWNMLKYWHTYSQKFNDYQNNLIQLQQQAKVHIYFHIFPF